MRSLYSILLESIEDSDEKVSQNTISAVYELVQQALHESTLDRMYKCELKGENVVISFSRSSVPAVWEAITYNTDDECISRGNNYKSGTGSLPANLIHLCRFENCMISIKGRKTILADLPSRCSKCYFYINIDASIGDSAMNKYFSEMAKSANFRDGNCLYIDPIFDTTLTKSASFISGISFRNFKIVRLTFNVDALSFKDVTARILVLGTWSKIEAKPAFHLHDYGSGADWETEEQSKWIDKIVTSNKLDSFGVNSNSVQNDIFFKWNKAKQLYEISWEEAGKLRVPKINR